MPTLQALTAALDDGVAGTSHPSPDGLVEQATQALDSLRELTHGIFPTMLARAGLGPALASHASRPGRAVELKTAESAQGRRFSDRTEAAAYFCCVAACPDASPAGSRWRSSGQRLSSTSRERP